MTEPTRIPSLASFRSSDIIGSPLPKERLAINSDTVKPIPPNNDTDAKLPQFEPSGIGASLSSIHKAEKINIPKNLPNTKPVMIDGAMPWNSCDICISPKKIPALANANRGTIT